MRILIAEDEQDLNRILAERLKSEHYSVDSCYNGQDALDYLDSAEYDALILDIMMPVMDGLTVLKKTPQPGFFPAGAASHRQRQCGRPGPGAGCRRQ